jgi:hypothetical protein
MERYLVVSPHTAEDCAKVIGQVYALGYVAHYDWGCGDGEHCGWAIVEADSANEALLSVPSVVRSKARAIRLKKISPQDAKSMHDATR